MSQARVSRFRRSRPYLFLVLAVLCILGAAIPLSRIPSIPEQLRDTTGNLVVALKKPANNSQWHLYTPIPISATSMGSQPIKSMELWADGVMVSTKDTSSGSASWTWTLPSSGEHILVVRAKDSAGHIANSNAVRVIGSDDTNPGMVLLYSPQNGDTPDSIASKFGSTPQQIAALNPQFGGGSPPNGGPIKVPIDSPLPPSPSGPSGSPPAPGGPSQPPSSNPPIPFLFWVSKFTVQNPPNAPALSANTKDCSASLLITDNSTNESGFNIYRLDPNQQVFKVVKTLGANGDASKPIEFDDEKLSGTFSYYVSAFNAKGEVPGNIASVNITNPDCTTPFWSGAKLSSEIQVPPSLIQNINAPPSTFDKTYFYFSINDSTWARQPKDPNAFLPGGIFNVDDQVKNLNLSSDQGQILLTIDAWGWSGGSLIHIGTFTRVLGAPNTPSQNYKPSALQICDGPTCKSDINFFVNDKAAAQYYAKWPFRWQAASSLQTNALAQVSVIPFDNTCDVNPAGVIWTENLTSAGYDNYTNFDIDFTQLKDKSALVNGWYLSGDTFYIRVIPMLGTQVICQPSNTVTWRYFAPTPGPLITPPPPAPAPPAAYIVKLVSFSSIQFPDFNYQYCVIVKENPYYNNPQAVADALANFDFSVTFWATVPVGYTVCPANYTPQEPSFWDNVSSWIADAVNFVANAYNDLKAFVVDLAAKLNPLCIQANLGAQAIGSGQDTVEDVCHKIAEATVDIGLAYVGLPPSLPNYDELVNAGKGYVADVAVEQLGDDCPDKDACKKIVEEGFNQMLSQLQQSQNNSSCLDEGTAHANGFEPLCAPSGVVTAPSPLGQLIPAIVTVQVTRDPNVPDSAFPDPSKYKTSCSFNVSVTAKNDSLIGQQIVIGLDTKTGTTPLYWTGTSISGTLFHGVGSKLPQMAPGETQTIPFSLTPNATEFPPPSSSDGFWLPGHLANDWDWNSIEQFPVHDHDDWRYLYFGSTATVKLNGGCTTSGSGLSPSSTTFSDQIIQAIPPAGQ